MSSPDLISVIVPAYNHENYVQDTIHSILNQTYPDIELVITNDGSPDHTHEKIEELLQLCRARCVRVKYINRPNEGYVRSLNQCLGEATGEYIYVIASDDVAHPDALTVLHRFLSSHSDYGLAVGDNAFIDGNGRTCYWGHKQTITYEAETAVYRTHAAYLKQSRQDVDFNGPSFGSYKSLLSGNYVPNGYLIRKSILDKFGGYSEKAPLEDMYLMLQIAKHAKLKYIDEVLFSYRWHDTNTIKQRGIIERYYEETLRHEIPYAKAHGYGKYLPLRKEFLLGGVKVFFYSRTASKTVLRILGITLYKHRKRAKAESKEQG
ncbi:MAG: glycosyltransferase family 2 protein [Pontiellaceae bacterium]|nr:glycosyltransferase family 2 protein [Pontiellaceae bacterium]MBN2784544.1 glycosyltransferase family 2 protein [Pontiellaceae bacterium]